MKKKLIATLLTVCMAVSMLTGCGGTSSGSQGAEGNGDAAANGDVTVNEEAGASEEPTHICVSFLIIPGSNTSGLEGMTEAVNAITIPEANIEVEFKTVEIFNTMNQYPLWVSSNEDIDLVCCAFTGISSLISQGVIMPMDEYIAGDEYIQTLLQDENIDIISGNMVNGETYALSPVFQYYGSGYGIHFRKDLLEEAGITIDETKTYSLDELEGVLAAIKEKHPDMYPLGITGADVSSSDERFKFVEELDDFGAGVNSGALMGCDSIEVVDVFETDAFHNFITKMAAWYQAGYIYPDALTTDLATNDLITNGVAAGYFMMTDPLQCSAATKTMDDAWGTESVCMRLTDNYKPSYANVQQWCLPITCDEPEAAVKFLSLMYENPDICTTMTFGIENEDWVKTDDPLVINFAEGKNQDNVSWYNGLVVYGDKRTSVTIDEVAISQEEYDAWTEECIANPTASQGFIYESGDMGMTIMNINAVLEQYLPQLECGTAEDVEKLYSEFISELKAAGIDEVVADKQAKFDAYLEEQ